MQGIPIDSSDQPQVILELLYRLKIRDVMTRKLVMAKASDPLRSVQKLMRENKITGVPIMSGEVLVGIVSMGDIIQALDSGWIDDEAGNHMSSNLVVLQDDMPLSFAISYLNKYGFGRFPVLDKDSRLCGIITASDVISTLLLELNKEVRRLEEDLKAQEPAGDAAMVMEFPTARFDFENAGHASAEFKKAMKNIGIAPETTRRVAIASYELEINQVIHSNGGTMRMSIGKDAITIRAEDTGPGIADIEEAMREGFSTANEWVRSLGFGAGMGLANTKRVSDEFDIKSAPGQGTAVTAVIALKHA
jgi:CBS domain-containing protein